ncbi:MAG: hypothetical protein IJV64_08810, partial [Oscillospiraceae bacterium]|nr:hypothetical protein [Oscillospiraceae bacterium]
LQIRDFGGKIRASKQQIHFLAIVLLRHRPPPLSDAETYFAVCPFVICGRRTAFFGRRRYRVQTLPGLLPGIWATSWLPSPIAGQTFICNFVLR